MSDEKKPEPKPEPDRRSLQDLGRDREATPASLPRSKQPVEREAPKPKPDADAS